MSLVNVQGLFHRLTYLKRLLVNFPMHDEQLDLVKVDDQTWKATGMLDLYQLELELGMIDLVEEDAGYISVAGLILG